MNVGGVIGDVLQLIGVVGLLFVVFLKIHDKFLTRYTVHYEDVKGNHSYSIVKACSKNSAVRKVVELNPNLQKITKIVRCRGE